MPSQMTLEVIPAGGNALDGQRSPGHSAANDREQRVEMAGRTIWSNLPRRVDPRRLTLWIRGKEVGKPTRRGAHASQRLNLLGGGKACTLTNVVQGRGQNRTREIRPSGIAGGLQETWPMVELGTHAATERADVVTLHLSVHAPDFYPDIRTHGLNGGLDTRTGGQPPETV